MALATVLAAPQFFAEAEAVLFALSVNELLMSAYKHMPVRDGVPPRIVVQLRTATGTASVNLRNPGELLAGSVLHAAASRHTVLDFVRSLFPARRKPIFKSLHSCTEVSLELSLRC